MRSSTRCIMIATLVIVLGPISFRGKQTAARKPRQTNSVVLTQEMTEDVAAFTGFLRGQTLTSQEREHLRSVMISAALDDGDFIADMCRDMHGVLEKLARQGRDDFTNASLREYFLETFYRTPPPVVPDVWFTVLDLINSNNPFLVRSPQGLILTRRGAHGYLRLFNWVATQAGRPVIEPNQLADAENQLVKTFHEGKSVLEVMARGESVWQAFQAALKIPQLRTEIDSIIRQRFDSSCKVADMVVAVAQVADRYRAMRGDELKAEVLASAGPYHLTEAMFEDFIDFCEYMTGRWFSRSDVARLRELGIADFPRVPETNVKIYESLHAKLKGLRDSYQIRGFHGVIQKREEDLDRFINFIPEGPENQAAHQLIERYLFIQARGKDAVLTQTDVLAVFAADLLVRLKLKLPLTDVSTRIAEQNRLTAAFPSLSPKEQDRLIHAPSRLIALADYLADPKHLETLKQEAKASLRGTSGLPALEEKLTDIAVATQAIASESKLATYSIRRSSEIHNLQMGTTLLNRALTK